MASMKKIVIGPPTIRNGNAVYSDITCSDSIKRYFKQNFFFAEYDRRISQVPPSLLVIPALSNICPIAWAVGADVYVDEIDRDFLAALKTVKRSFQAMYPKMQLRGKIRAKKVVENRGYSRGKKAMLFSGGVDSLSTYISRRAEHPSLVTVWGADIKLNRVKAWNRVTKQVKRFAEANDLIHTSIKSNLRTFLNNQRLDRFFTRGWWAQIQHGVGLLGLCAPLSFLMGIETLYIASTCSKEAHYPWGSHPDIDNFVKWGETQVIHDGFEYGRQQKTKIIADYLKKENSLRTIRVCYVSKDGRNCSRCRKCYETMVGLLLEGIDPNRYGFALETKTLETIRQKMIQGKFRLPHKAPKHMLSRWELIQKSIPENWDHIREEHREFFQWMSDTDLKPLLGKSPQ